MMLVPLNMSELTRDAFRSLRMNISFSGGDKDVQTLVVTSAVPSEGKTSVSVGLGVSMAESMKNTLIVECDCRRPSVGNRLKMRPPLNWIDVLYQKATIDEAVVETDCPNLYFLDAEPGLVHSVELLNSGRFREMVEQLKTHFDFIIFDTPPLGSFIDAAVLAEHSDGAIVVITSGNREIRLVKQTVEQLKKANAKIMGIVLNKVNAHRSGYYQYGDYYYRKRGKERSGAPKEEAKPVQKRAAGAAKKPHERSAAHEKEGAGASKRSSASRAPKGGAHAQPEATVGDDLSWEEYIDARKASPNPSDPISSATSTPSKPSENP